MTKICKIVIIVQFYKSSILITFIRMCLVLEKRFSINKPPQLKISLGSNSSFDQTKYLPHRFYKYAFVKLCVYLSEFRRHLLSNEVTH